MTGKSPTEISDKFPGIGLTGSPSTMPEFTWWSKVPAAQNGTIIHDWTSEFNDLISGMSLNKIFWGYESDIWSALSMYSKAILSSPGSALIAGTETIFDFLVDEVGDLFDASFGETSETYSGTGGFTLKRTQSDGSEIYIRGSDLNGDRTIDVISKEYSFEANGTTVQRNWEMVDSNGNPIGDGDISVTWPNDTVKGERIGAILGSSLGKYIGGDDVFKQIATGSILEATLGNIGEALQIYGYEVPLTAPNGQPASLGESINAAFDDFSQDVVDSLKGSVVGAISSYLTVELVQGLGLDGTAADIFSTASNTALNQVLINIANGAPWSSGINYASFANAFGSLYQFNVKLHRIRLGESLSA